jgi:hypothetical protein
MGGLAGGVLRSYEMVCPECGLAECLERRRDDMWRSRCGGEFEVAPGPGMRVRKRKRRKKNMKKIGTAGEGDWGRIEHRDPKDLKSHEKNGLFGDIPETEYEEMKADIEARGIKTPLFITPDGRVLSGHLRLKVALEIGLSAVPVIVVDGLTEDGEFLFLVRDNLVRRHLSPSQRALLVTRPEIRSVMGSLMAEAKARQVEGAATIRYRFTSVTPPSGAGPLVAELRKSKAEAAAHLTRRHRRDSACVGCGKPAAECALLDRTGSAGEFHPGEGSGPGREPFPTDGRGRPMRSLLVGRLPCARPPSDTGGRGPMAERAQHDVARTASTRNDREAEESKPRRKEL